jgi:MFS family permease
VLGLDARGLAYLWAATGTGALISALVMAPLLSRERGRGRMLAMAMLLFGLVVTAFALSGQFIWSLLGLMLVGGGMVSVTITINALLQTLVRDEMRGRVMSLYSLAFLGVPPIGSLLIGAVAELLGGYGGWHGVQLAMALGGLVIVLLALLVIVAVPRLREME